MLSRTAVVVDLAVVVATIGQLAAVSRLVEPLVLGTQTLDALGFGFVVLIALTIVRGGLCGTREFVGQHGSIRTRARLRSQAMSRLVARGPSMVHGERVGELVALLGGGLDRLDPWISRYLPQRVLALTGPAVIGGYVCWLDPLSGALLLCSAPVLPVLMVAVGSHTEERTRQQWNALAQLSAHLFDLIQGLPTLKLLGHERHEAIRLEQSGLEFCKRTMTVLRQAFLSGLVLELMTSAAVAVVAVELGLRLLDGAIGFAVALQVLLLAPEFYRPLRELGVQRHAALEGQPVAERIDALLHLGDSNPPMHVAVVSVSRSAAVSLVGVSYRYPTATEPALEDLTLELPSRTRTALVGPSGAGKSTLVKLLLRFVEPSSGSIYACGEPIADLAPSEWRQRVALVPQHPYLFDASVLDNLRLARPGANLESVRYAAELAGADEFLRRLPDGYLTRLGERGARLSRGEAQRLAIARAFLKDAPLLILDEATSALDAANERAIRDSLDRLADNRTVLMVAHRLNAILTADQIIVLEAGRLVECGAHAELLQRNGLYARLFGRDRLAIAT